MIMAICVSCGYTTAVMLSVRPRCCQPRMAIAYLPISAICSGLSQCVAFDPNQAAGKRDQS